MASVHVVARRLAQSAARTSSATLVRARPAMFCVPSGCTVREVKVKASAVRRGSVIDVDGKLLVVVDASFVKTAMRRAQITMEVRDMKSGNKTKQIFRSTDDVEVVDLTKVRCQYLYQEGKKYFFMRQDTFETIELDESAFEEPDLVKFLTENMDVNVETLENGTPLNVFLPETVTMKVISTDSSLGDTQSGKPAVLEGGLKLVVPNYINTNDAVVIHVREKRFLSRESGGRSF